LTEICAICKKDIEKLNCFPVYYSRLDDVICSDCYLIIVSYELGIIDYRHIKDLPKYIQKECFEYRLECAKKQLEVLK